MHRPYQSAAPAADPVTLTEVKAHLRVDHSDEDTLIASYTSAAVAHLDGWTGVLGRCMVTQKWVQKFDRWGAVMRLPFPDVQSVVITYIDTDDATQTVSSDLYSLFDDAKGGYVRFEDSFTRPNIGPDFGGVMIEATCGYGDASAVPAPLKAAVLLYVGTLYENRETLSEKVSPNMAFESLIAPYRRVGV